MRIKWLAAGLLALLIALPARAGGKLVVCDDVSQPETLDPQHEFNEKSHTIVQQIYDGLVRFDPLGVIEPALALKWVAVPNKEDQARGHPWPRMRFTLREGVTFHNGEPFNAEAVRFSIDRYKDPKTQFPAVGFIDSIEKAVVIDPYTVEIVTKYPDGLLLARLAGFIVIVPPKYVAEHGEAALNKTPIGTGAFRFTRWVEGKQIELAANTSYWMAGFPKLDELVFRFAQTDEQANLLQSGQVDLVTEMPGTYTAKLKENPATTIRKQSTYWTLGASMNVTSGPLADVRVRKALNLAINRDDLIRYDSRGNGTALASLTMPGEEGHNPDLKPYPYDPEQAKKLLAEAGIKTPLVLKTHVRAQALCTANILASQFKKIGVELNIEAVSADAEARNRVASETWDIGISGLPDPMCNAFFIQSILLFSNSPFSITKDKGFDGLLMKYVTTLNDPVTNSTTVREAAGSELDKYVYDQCLSLFTYQKTKTYGLSRKVDFVPYITGMPYFLTASVQDTPVPAQASVDTKTP